MFDPSPCVRIIFSWKPLDWRNARRSGHPTSLDCKPNADAYIYSFIFTFWFNIYSYLLIYLFDSMCIYIYIYLRAAAPAADPGKVKKPREVHDLDSVAIGCWLLLALAASYWLCAPFACSCPRSWHPLVPSLKNTIFRAASCCTAAVARTAAASACVCCCLLMLAAACGGLLPAAGAAAGGCCCCGAAVVLLQSNSFQSKKQLLLLLLLLLLPFCMLLPMFLTPIGAI